MRELIVLGKITNREGKNPQDGSQLARYGLTIDQANMAIMSAVGGEGVTTTVEGRERYPVNVRYLRDYRSAVDRSLL